MNLTPLQRLAAKLVLALLFGLIAWWLITSLYSDQKPVPKTESPAEVVGNINFHNDEKFVPPPPSERPVDSLVVQDGSYECKFDGLIGNEKSLGHLYVSGGKMRGEFGAPTPGFKREFWVYDGKYLYDWKDHAEVGIKKAITSTDQFPKGVPADLLAGSISGTSYESDGWRCQHWEPDSSLLEAPADVKFKF